MKKITIIQYMLCILGMCTLWSCTKDPQNTTTLPQLEESLVGKTITFDKLFDVVSTTKIDLSSDTVIYIKYAWNKANNTVQVSSFNKKETNLFLIDFPADDEHEYAQSTEARAAHTQYKVSCENGKSSWTKTCDGKVSCAGLVLDCLDKGGCATVCESTMLYVPHQKTFILLSKDAEER